MKSSSIRVSFKFKNKLSLFFAEYKFAILFSLIFLIFGACLGIFTAVKYSGEIELDNLADSNLVDFLKGDKGTMGLYFPYLFSFLLSISLIIFLNFKPFLIIVNAVVLVIRSYVFGFNITVLIILYGFAGIINVIIVIIPFELIIWLVLITMSAIAIKRNKNIKQFGCGPNCKKVGFNYSKTYCCLAIIGALTLLIKCFVMPIIRVTIIVN